VGRTVAAWDNMAAGADNRGRTWAAVDNMVVAWDSKAGAGNMACMEDSIL